MRDTMRRADGCSTFTSMVISTITSTIGAGVLLAVAGGGAAAQSALTPGAVTAPAAPVTMAAVPFAVGETLTYKASFGRLRAGTARMTVAGIEVVRGRPAYHVVFTLEGGIPLLRVRDRYESWIDVETLASLRHRQDISEGRYKRTTTYEIYPDRVAYRRDADSLEASVRDPLDDASFLYAVRVAAVRVGETRREDRYFRPDRNPVLLAGVRHDTVTTPAGRFPSVVVAPSIKARGIFGEGGEARVWFSDDARRYPVRVESRFSGIGITLVLQSVTAGETAGAAVAVGSAAPAGGDRDGSARP